MRQRLQAGGYALEAEILGELRPGRPTLVFLHEGLGSIAQWKDFPAALAERCGLPAVVYERWGFGGSEALVLPRQRDYLQQEAEVALPDLLTALGVDRPLLYGHSDGGSIALLFAAAFPGRPLACITEAAHVFVEEVSLAGIREAVEAWQNTGLPQRLARYHGNQAETVFRGWADTWLRPDFRDWTVSSAALARIACPCLVAQGADDRYGTLEQVERIASGVSGTAEQLVIPGCGHAPHREARETMLSEAARFIARCL